VKNVYFTSFQMSAVLPPGVTRMSVAVYQPKGYDYPKVDWTDIRREGHWIRPRDFLSFEQPLVAYHDALYALYMERKQEAEWWRDATPWDVALCCWCPYDQAAQRQLKDFGSFVCHTAVLSEYIYNELGVAVWEDGNRRHMAVLGQKGLA